MTNRSNMSDAIDGIFNAAKSHPEGLLLLAAGVALMMRSGKSRQPQTQMSSQGRAQAAGVGAGQSRRRDSLASTAGEYVSEAGEYLSDATEKVSAAAGRYAGAASDYASSAGKSAAQQTTRLAQQAQSTFQSSLGRVLKEQPLAVGIAGIAAGAALAAVFPATDMEKQAFGPAAEAVADVASQAGQQLKEAATKVGDTLKAEADDRGLNTDGLKEVAKEAAAAFTTTLSGRGEAKPGSTSPSSSSSSPSSSSSSSSPSSTSPSKGNNPGKSPSQDQWSSAGFDPNKNNKR
jgi:hypothetical protein